MKISEALGTTSDLTIPFGTSVLHVTYRPSAVTIADIEALKADRDIKRVADQIRQQVVQWDLESDQTGKIIPLEPPLPKVVTQDGDPVEPGDPSRPRDGFVQAAQDDPLHQVPVSILTKILIAIQTDQRPDPEV